MRGFCSLLSVLACSLWLIPAAQAQSGKGAIAGHVTDSSGGALIGAQAAVQPGGVNVASDGRGQFFVNDLDPGSYTVTVTYVGFETFTQTLDVTAGRAASVDAKLEVESVSLKVLVTAERASGEAEAINREITADNIVQVLPADVIRSLPNANMADALGRLPSVTIERDEGEGKYVQVRGTEPRLTNTTIDGINVPSPESGVRQIKFDAIPARLERLKKSGMRQLSRTDTDSRFLPDRRGFTLGYTATLAVSDDHLIIAQQVSREVNDNGLLVPMVDRVQRECGAAPRQVSADSGFFSLHNLQVMEERGIDAYVPDSNMACALHRGRELQQSVYHAYHPAHRRLRKKLDSAAGRALYRRRKAVVEPVFGILKEQRGMRRFRMRGLGKVAAEFALTTIAFNLMRMWQLTPR